MGRQCLNSGLRDTKAHLHRRNHYTVLKGIRQIYLQALKHASPLHYIFEKLQSLDEHALQH